MLSPTTAICWSESNSASLHQTQGASGRRFVGSGARREGSQMVSRDGARRYRPPSLKKGGRVQANFETRAPGHDGAYRSWNNGKYTRRNYHVDVKSWRRRS